MRKSLKQPVSGEQTNTVSSAVAIRQHPLHPMLVVYPIACLTLLPASDLALLWSGEPFWGQVSLLLNMVGLAGGLLAAVVGTCDMLLIRVARRHVSVWSHALAAVMLLAVSAAGVRLRLVDAVEAVWPWGLMLSSTGLLLAGVAGWLGGTLTFKYGIGVYGDGTKEEDGGGGTPPAP